MVHGTNGLHVVRKVRGTNSQWYEKSRHPSQPWSKPSPVLTAPVQYTHRGMARLSGPERPGKYHGMTIL